MFDTERPPRHDYISDTSRRIRRALQHGQVGRLTAADRIMYEYFHQQAAEGNVEIQVELARWQSRHYSQATRASLMMRNAQSTATGADARRSARLEQYPLPPRATGGSQGISGGGGATPIVTYGGGNADATDPFPQDVEIVPESDEEEYSSTTTESEEEGMERLTRIMMLQEASARNECNCSSDNCRHKQSKTKLKSALDKVRDTDDRVAEGIRKLKVQPAGKPTVEDAIAKMGDDAPPNFRWVQIEIE